MSNLLHLSSKALWSLCNKCFIKPYTARLSIGIMHKDHYWNPIHSVLIQKILELIKNDNHRNVFVIIKAHATYFHRGGSIISNDLLIE